VEQDAIAMYSVSVVDSDVDVYILLSHATKNFPKKNAHPLVFFLSSILLAQSASMYAVRLKYLSFGYHNPSSKVPLRYLNILFTSFK
jgi:hypothetical protein